MPNLERSPSTGEIYSYTATHYPNRGVVVTGRIPVDFLGGLFDACRSVYGFDVCDFVLAKHFSACFVMTNDDCGDAWRNELGIHAV